MVLGEHNGTEILKINTMVLGFFKGSLLWPLHLFAVDHIRLMGSWIFCFCFFLFFYFIMLNRQTINKCQQPLSSFLEICNTKTEKEHQKGKICSGEEQKYDITNNLKQ